jgi:uncharacterized membrane protein
VSKLEFIDALKRAMEGLPIEAQAKTLAYYEQRFVDAAAAGLSEDEIVADLGDPRKIAMSLRASAHAESLQQQPARSAPASAMRVLFSAIGLAIFNLFMIIPGAVYASLVAALYACTLAFYGSGIVIAASGVAGANELTLDAPLRNVRVGDGVVIENSRTPTRVVIDESGIRVSEISRDRDGDGDNEDPADRVIDRAEQVALEGIQISTEMDDASRTKMVVVGVGLVLLGVGLALMSIVVTRWTFIGLKRYVQMNISLLKGH